MKTDSQQSETVAEAKSEATLAAPSGSVFEVVDSSNEETCWTLGIWPTLQEALAALPEVGCNEADEYDEHRTIEARERGIGWGGHGKRVAGMESYVGRSCCRIQVGACPNTERPKLTDAAMKTTNLQQDADGRV